MSYVKENAGIQNCSLMLVELHKSIVMLSQKKLERDQFA